MSEVDVCDWCDEERPVTEGENVVTDRTYVDHMQVSEDTVFICSRCVEEAEDRKTEAALDAYEWRGYDAWESQAKNGVTR